MVRGHPSAPDSRRHGEFQRRGGPGALAVREQEGRQGPGEAWSVPGWTGPCLQAGHMRAPGLGWVGREQGWVLGLSPGADGAGGPWPQNRPICLAGRLWLPPSAPDSAGSANLLPVNRSRQPGRLGRAGREWRMHVHISRRQCGSWEPPEDSAPCTEPPAPPQTSLPFLPATCSLTVPVLGSWPDLA